MKSEERDRLLEESKKTKDKAVKECFDEMEKAPHLCQKWRSFKDAGDHVLLHEGIVRLILEIQVND